MSGTRREGGGAGDKGAYCLEQKKVLHSYYTMLAGVFLVTTFQHVVLMFIYCSRIRIFGSCAGSTAWSFHHTSSVHQLPHLLSPSGVASKYHQCTYLLLIQLIRYTGIYYCYFCVSITPFKISNNK